MGSIDNEHEREFKELLEKVGEEVSLRLALGADLLETERELAKVQAERDGLLRDRAEADAEWRESVVRRLKGIHKRLKAQRDAAREVVEAARRAKDKQAEAVAIMRKHGFKFETPLHQSEGFEKLAFTFYTMLVEVADDLDIALSNYDEKGVGNGH